MKEKNISLELLISEVKSLINNSKYESDNLLIQKLYNDLQMFKNDNVTNDLIDEVEKSINVLNQNYDDLFELENLYDVIKYQYNNQLKKEMVSKLREENRKKRL